MQDIIGGSTKEKKNSTHTLHSVMPTRRDVTKNVSYLPQHGETTQGTLYTISTIDTGTQKRGRRK